MLKKTVKYLDFDGNPQSEDLYFNLSKTEIVEMHTDGIVELMTNMIKPGADNAEIIKTFKKIIGLAYGVRSEDGRRFRKNHEQTADFLSSPAYDALFMELVTGTDGDAVKFVMAMLPPDIANQAAEEAAKSGVKVVIPITDAGPSLIKSAITDVVLPESKEQSTVPEAFRAKKDPLAEMSIADLEAALERRKNL